jgi:hypothetical protein
MRKRKTASVYFVCFAALMLMAQLVITSGHIHLPGSPGDYAHNAAALLSDSRVPPHDKPHSGHDGFCVLCWAQAMTGSSLIPSPAALLHPVLIASSSTIVFPEHFDEAAPPSPFNPRAPPLSARA